MACVARGLGGPLTMETIEFLLIESFPFGPNHERRFACELEIVEAYRVGRLF